MLMNRLRKHSLALAGSLALNYLAILWLLIRIGVLEHSPDPSPPRSWAVTIIPFFLTFCLVLASRLQRCRSYGRAVIYTVAAEILVFIAVVVSLILYGVCLTWLHRSASNMKGCSAAEPTEWAQPATAPMVEQARRS